MDRRLSPEKLLERVKKEEQQEKRGKLKIYLGAAPGVGKTYTMLHDALAKRQQGLDVVVGVVESHGRSEIESMLKNFEILPRKCIDYRGKSLLEFDLDGAFKRNPGLILIDEMAHTNVPGAHHIKRWQDIKELLDRGFDVYTTLNVQHIESLNDAVSQIIHSHVSETVPDSMLELSDTIELVDLPPEDLLKRLQEGKVYFPAQAELAKDHFFRKGNLSALRELALRVTAERVGTQVLSYRQDLGIKYIWPTKEKILVCIGHHVESSKLIRAARRMAKNIQAEWMALHVETPQKQLAEEEKKNITQNLRLAEMLGAETHIISGFDITKEIMTFAREQNATQIIIGKINRPRWKNIFFGSLADEIVRRSGEIDVYIITSESNQIKKSSKTVNLKKALPWRTYLLSLSLIVIATLFNFALFPLVRPSNLIMIYLLAITCIALFGQLWLSFFASLFTVLLFEFFFVPPYFSFATNDAQSIFTLGLMLIISQTVSYLVIIARRQAKAARFREHQTAALNKLNRQLIVIRGSEKILEVGVQFIGELFSYKVLALLPKDGQLTIMARFKTNQTLDEKELGVAQWVYDLGETAGSGTDTLPFAGALYIPLLTTQGSIGVLRLQPLKTKHLLSANDMRLLESCAHLLALSVEAEQTIKKE